MTVPERSGGLVGRKGPGAVRFFLSGKWIFFHCNVKRAKTSVAKTSPIEFFNQVKAEARKIVWPTSRETLMTTVMVMIMTGLLGIFFFGIDSLFGWIVKILLGLAAGQG